GLADLPADHSQGVGRERVGESGGRSGKERLDRSNAVWIRETVGHVRLSSLLPFSQRLDFGLLALCAVVRKVERTGDLLPVWIDDKQGQCGPGRRQGCADIRERMSAGVEAQQKRAVYGECGVELLRIVGRRLIEAMVVGLDYAGAETVGQV